MCSSLIFNYVLLRKQSNALNQICFKTTQINQFFLVAGEKMENGTTFLFPPIAISLVE